MSQTTSPGVPMTADSTDRDALARVIAVRMANISSLPDWMQTAALGRDMMPLGELAADAAIAAGWVRATGPARDEGQEMRCPTCGVRPGYRCRTPANRVTGTHVARTRMNAASPTPRDEGLRERIEALCDEADAPLYDRLVASVQLRAALAASPAPGGDTAPREERIDGYDNDADAAAGYMAHVGSFRVAAHDALGAIGSGDLDAARRCLQHAEDSFQRDKAVRHDKVAPLLVAAGLERGPHDEIRAARPVPPSPAATRDGEAG